jgi:nicotinamidase-related amidase
MAPLLQPTECCVLLVDPRKQHIADLHESRQRHLSSSLTFLAKGALTAGIPGHLAFVAAVPDPDQWLVDAAQFAPARVHALGNSGSPSVNSDLDSALTAHNRRSLILAGFWLETRVTFMALPALATGFEVFVVIDATAACNVGARSAAIHRLLHAGAVLTTTHQLIAEWTETSSDPDQRSALSLLVSRR